MDVVIKLAMKPFSEDKRKYLWPLMSAAHPPSKGAPRALRVPLRHLARPCRIYLSSSPYNYTFDNIYCYCLSSECRNSQHDISVVQKFTSVFSGESRVISSD